MHLAETAFHLAAAQNLAMYLMPVLGSMLLFYGIYQVVITLHSTSDTAGTAYMNIRGLDQGFETNGNWSTIELTPAGMTFVGDMKHLQVFYGLSGYGATHSVSFTNITVTQ